MMLVLELVAGLALIGQQAEVKKEEVVGLPNELHDGVGR
jgi:hypothetical protein